MDSQAGSIVVGVDGSKSSRAALSWAAAQAVAEKRPLTLVHAIPPVPADYLDATSIHPLEREVLDVEGHRVLAAARGEVEKSAPGLEVREVLALDDPREVLLELSGEASVVVLGSRGRGKMARLLLGSVSVAVARHARCPIVVHRPGNPGAVRNGILVGADGSEESRAVLEFAFRQASLHDLPLTVLHCLMELQATTAAAYIVPETAVDLETERLRLAESMIGFAERYPEVVAHTELAHGHAQHALVTLGEKMNLSWSARIRPSGSRRSCSARSRVRWSSTRRARWPSSPSLRRSDA